MKVQEGRRKVQESARAVEKGARHREPAKMSYAGGFPVFISHSASIADRELVKVFRSALRRRKFDPYVASFEVQPGRKVKDKLQANLERCRAVVVLFTPSAQRSEWVPFEWGMASLMHKPIIPVVEIGTDPPRSLAGVEYVRFDRENLGPTIDVVVRYLAKLRENWRYVVEVEGLAVVGGFLLASKLYDLLKKRKD